MADTSIGETTVPQSQYLEPLVLNQLAGPLVGCIRTAITAPAATTTTINVGSTATGGTSGGLDAAIPANGFVIIGTPGTGATQNQYTNIDVLFSSAGASSGATTIAIPSQTIGKSRAVGDFIFQLCKTTAAGPFALNNTLYLGLSSATYIGATDASIKAGEPTSNAYARIALLNNPTNFPGASGSQPATTSLSPAQTFPTSTGAWNSGSALTIGFLSDSPTIGAGNIIWYGQLSPNTLTVTGTGGIITFNAFGVSLQEN